MSFSKILRPILVALIVLACWRSLPGSAQESRAQKPQPSEPAGVTLLRDVAYVSNGHARQKLDLYLPGKGTSRPLIVWIHGGGWENGSKEACPAKGMLGRGYAV